MSYAVRKDNQGFRAVQSASDCTSEETWQAEQPVILAVWSPNALLYRARALREECLNRLAGIGLIALADGDSATVAAVKTARQSLLDITNLPAVKAATNNAELTVAITAAYAAIVAACPVGLRSAFKDARL